MTSSPFANLLNAHRMLLTFTCATALAVPAFAQEPTAPPPQQQTDHAGRGERGAEMQQHQLERMTKALNLTPDQVTQIKAIQDDGRQQMMALRNDNSTAGPDKHAKMMSLREAQESKMKGVLNDDQKTKFDKMLAREREHNEEHHEGHRGGEQTPPPPPPAA